MVSAWETTTANTGGGRIPKRTMLLLLLLLLLEIDSIKKNKQRISLLDDSVKSELLLT
jgi:hypothetical protein